ncbi:MAG: hypothetical protein AAF483_24995 [Planctomycetota bacterium]
MSTLDENPFPLASFVEGLLGEAIAHVPAWKEPSVQDESHTLELLEKAHQVASESSAHVAPAIDPSSALWAARLTHWLCWQVLCPGESSRQLPATLAKPPSTESPGTHFAVDLCLRFAPSIEQQISRTDGIDGMEAVLARLLEPWPLSALGTKIQVSAQSLRVILEDGCLRACYRDRFIERGANRWPTEDPSLREKISRLVRETVGEHPELIPTPLHDFFNPEE